METIQPPNTAVVVVPFPAQGHLNQLLHLSRLLAGYNLPIHIITTTTHGRQVKTRIHGWNPLSIHFHHYPTDHFDSPPPDPTATVKFPDHLIPSFKSAMHLRQPFVDLLSTLSSAAKRVVVIHDYLMSTVVQDAVSYTNVETYMFTCCSAFTSFWYNWESTGRPSLDGELQSILKELPSNEDCMSTDGLQFILSIDVSYKRFSSGMILDSCRVIEGKYIDLLEQEEARDHQKLWALGPFNPVAITRDSSPNRHKLFDWLDKQASNSVLYVSFGTTTSISNEQIQELAMGLEQSEQRFIWVLRDADKGDIFDGEVRKIELPKGFEERVGENGLVVVDWVPQPEILGHPATGGFMSHCGWNSSTESITMGVPVAAWPMHSDQPRNAMLITKVLNIGIYVRDWTRREELISSTVVEEAVRKLMASEEGEEMRKRAAELGGRVRRSVEDGGVRRIELDSFVGHITR
ncbi:zeatin O-glucosyltransferase-like [Cynara cardunculus var. scolymus]|uniref:zeatin O-glucosyltransferase-like n=1 Tax=Cynara cardunculus var. scolymus TaxID=59895 RepID=UPI000D6283AF|nr:zeatin O-glucosyltransferase-like [Cynara cardunculus var. scolymus]